MQNYVAENYGNVYLTDGEHMNIVGIGAVSLRESNGMYEKFIK